MKSSKLMVLALFMVFSGGGCAYTRMYDASTQRFCQAVALYVEAEEYRQRKNERDAEYHRYLEYTRSKCNSTIR